MTQQQPSGQTRRTRGRSPGYPGINLEEALARARTLLAKEPGKHAVPVHTILGHWDFKPNSGPGFIAIAALKKFGLLHDEGTGPTRKARLSEDALSIIQDGRPDSAERQELIRKAALAPPIHAELWQQYGGSLPSDSGLRFMLLRERNFTESGADEFIPEFRSTLAFANLLEGDKLEDRREDKPPAADESGFLVPPAELQDTPAGASTKKPVVQLLPIAPSEWAVLQAAFPLTPQKWDQMLAVLEAMKPALVQAVARGPDSTVLQEDTSSWPLTAEAQELLKKVDDGGVPVFATGNLERIARENGISVSPDMTPNQIIEELLQKSLD